MNNMAGFNTGNAAIGNVPMTNGGNSVPGRIVEEPDDNQNLESRLNTYIYDYLCNRGMYDVARTLKNTNANFEPPLENSDVNGDMPMDSKDGMDLKRPDDLPHLKNIPNDGQGGSFLLGWFSSFWDIYFASRKRDPRASDNASMYVQHTQVRLLQNLEVAQSDVETASR